MIHDEQVLETDMPNCRQKEQLIAEVIYVNIDLLSTKYSVRALCEDDIPAIYELCSGNPQYYEYCPPPVTRESIRADLHALPPGKTMDDKYSLGFCQKDRLIAMMDLITHFPEEGVAWIGLFMTTHDVQRQGVGSDIVWGVCNVLAREGFREVQLAFVKDNPQAATFWNKAKFNAISESANDEGIVFTISSRPLFRITSATPEDAGRIKCIVHTTISKVYPRYYPAGAVQFFLDHHSDEHIEMDVYDGKVFLLFQDEEPVGTVTISGNEIKRLFVLPDYQGRGVGSAMLDYAEQNIHQSHPTVLIDASFPAKPLYLKRGYAEREYHIIETSNGDYLCYDVMYKTF